MNGRGFKISKIQLTIPVTYKTTDYNGEEFKDRFMNKNFKRRSKTYLKRLVKWLGYNDSFNS